MKNNKNPKMIRRANFIISPPKPRVICLTRDKSTYHHQSDVPPQPLVCPRHDCRDGKNNGPGLKVSRTTFLIETDFIFWEKQESWGSVQCPNGPFPINFELKDSPFELLSKRLNNFHFREKESRGQMWKGRELFML